MIDFFGLSIPDSEIVRFLQVNMQLKEICQKIFYQKLIAQAALERSLIVNPEEIRVEAYRLHYEKYLEKGIDIRAWLTDQMMTVEDLEAGIHDRLLAQKLSNFLFTKEVENLFIQNQVFFEQVLLYQIIVPYQRLAQELFYQIQEEEISFYQAAHLYDIDERRREHCGYEGKVYRWELNPALVNVVFTASVGELIGPITTEQGNHILLVEEVIPAELTIERHQQILEQLFKNWLQTQLNLMISNTKK